MLQSFCYDFICFFLNVRVCFIIFATNIVLFFTRIFFRMLSYHTRTHIHADRCAVEFAARGFRCTYIHTYIRKDTHRSNRILAIESCKNINEHRYEHCTYFLGIVWQFGRGHSRNPTSFRRAFFSTCFRDTEPSSSGWCNGLLVLCLFSRSPPCRPISQTYIGFSYCLCPGLCIVFFS